jgi:hypothetical protein
MSSHPEMLTEILSERGWTMRFGKRSNKANPIAFRLKTGPLLK